MEPDAFDKFKKVITRNLQIPENIANQITEITAKKNTLTGGIFPAVVLESGEIIQLKRSHFINSNYMKHAGEVRQNYRNKKEANK